MAFLQRTMNRGSVSTGYDIDNSVKLESNNSEFFQKSNSGAGNRQTWTYSTWIKMTETGVNNYFLDAYNNSNTWFILGVADTGKIVFYDIISGTDYGKQTNRLLRDTSAWYHVVFVSDTTNGTAGDRYRLYINGVRETSFATDYGDVPQNYNGNVNDAIQHNIGRRTDGTTYFNGYLAETILVDGTALDPDSFGEFDSSGIWKPIEITDTSFTWGTNGLWLNYSNASSMGANSAGTGGYSVQNINQVDQATDTPTNNFCTLLGQQQDSVTGTEPSIKEGGTTMFGGATSSQNAIGTMGVRSGKWYFESTITNSGGVGTENHNFGVVAADQITALSTGGGNDLGYVSGGWACASNSSPRNNNAAASGANATSALAVDKIMGCAVDMDNGKIWWHNEGTWHSLNSTVGNPANGTTPAFSNLLTATDEPLLPAGGFYINDNNQVRVMNFGGYAQAVFTAVGTYADANGYGSFAYQPPTGFYAICGKNLAEFGGTA